VGVTLLTLIPMVMVNLTVEMAVRQTFSRMHLASAAVALQTLTLTMMVFQTVMNLATLIQINLLLVCADVESLTQTLTLMEHQIVTMDAPLMLTN
jgi:hypothetical protein